MISSETKELLSIVIKESLFRNYSAAEYLIKKYNLTKTDKEKIDKNITDEKLKRAIYEILSIDSDKH